MPNARSLPISWSHPLWEIGFRPFYLMAALFAAIALPGWLGQLTGAVGPSRVLPGALWHAHEMVFGFAPAVLTGFLLTAAQNWTGQKTASRMPLMALCLLWLAGRILLFTGPATIAMPIDALFLPSLAVAVALPILQSQNYRNLIVVLIVSLMAAANILFHLAQADYLGSLDPMSFCYLGLVVFVLLMTLMAGRIIPAFTKNALPQSRARRHPALEMLVLATTVGWAGLETVSLFTGSLSAAAAWLALAAGISHTIRLWLWDPVATRRQSLLWALPLAYSWLPVAFFLRATDLFLDDGGLVPAFHAIGIGTMAGLMLAMMCRSARGHTGQPLVASRTETAAFVMVWLAAAVRVFGLWLIPDAPHLIYGISALCWTLAFGLFTIRFWPLLLNTR